MASNKNHRDLSSSSSEHSISIHSDTDDSLPHNGYLYHSSSSDSDYSLIVNVDSAAANSSKTIHPSYNINKLELPVRVGNNWFDRGYYSIRLKGYNLQNTGLGLGFLGRNTKSLLIWLMFHLTKR
jgi:hypothetical protein